MTLEDALYRLLYLRSTRDAFLSGTSDGMDLDPEDREALSALDRGQLISAADKVLRQILTRRHRGIGGLSDIFAGSLAAYRAANPEDADLTALSAGFLESEAAESWREYPWHDGPGRCLEDAFGLYLRDRTGRDPAGTDAERLVALLKLILLVSPRDTPFILPNEIRSCPGGYFLILGEPPVLHSAVRGTYVSGGLTASIVDILEGRTTAAGPVRDRLVAMGLLA